MNALYRLMPLLLLAIMPGCHKRLPLFMVDGTGRTQDLTAFGAGQSNMANMNILVFRDSVHISRAYNQAVGGSTLDEWMPGSAYYARLVQGVKAQNQPVTCVLWWQGEAEALGAPGTNYATWGPRFTQMVAQFRADTGTNIRFIIVRLGPSMPGYETAWNSIRDQQAALAIPNSTVLYIDDVPRNSGVHYDAAGYDVIIHRLANIYLGDN